MNKPVLDACCGSRMFWFDPADDRAVFGDIRCETHILTDRSSAGGSRKLIIDPDLPLDFRDLPFADDSFHLVVFDPPHLIRNGKSGWLAKKYGKLGDNWQHDIRAGFAECFRVLRPGGTLIFKWNEHEVKVSEILKLTDHKPLFGNRCGKTAKSHWIVFMKPEATVYQNRSRDRKTCAPGKSVTNRTGNHSTAKEHIMTIKGANTKDLRVVIEVSDDMLEAAYKAIAGQIDLDQFGLHGSVIVFPILEALESSATYDIRFRISEGDR